MTVLYTSLWHIFTTVYNVHQIAGIIIAEKVRTVLYSKLGFPSLSFTIARKCLILQRNTGLIVQKSVFHNTECKKIPEEENETKTVSLK